MPGTTVDRRSTILIEIFRAGCHDPDLLFLVELLGRYSNRTDWVKLTQKLTEQPPCAPKAPRKPRQVVRKLQPQEIESLAADYQAGAEVRELATRYQVHRTTVTALLLRTGVTLRQRGLTDDQISEAATFYREGWAVARIGDHFGVDGTTVWRSLRQHGVVLRKPYERGV
jgi:transposase